MKFVTNTAAIITNNMFPIYHSDTGNSDWSKVVMAEAGTVFKVKAIMQQMVFLENNKHSVNVDVNLFKEFFVEHEVEV